MAFNDEKERDAIPRFRIKLRDEIRQITAELYAALKKQKQPAVAFETAQQKSSAVAFETAQQKPPAIALEIASQKPSAIAVTLNQSSKSTAETSQELFKEACCSAGTLPVWN